MTNLPIAATIFVLGLVFIIISLFLKEHKRSGFYSMAGFLVFLLLGLTVIAGSPITYKTGATSVETFSYTVVNSTSLLQQQNTTELSTFTPDTGFLSTLPGWIMMLGGLLGILLNTISMFEEKRDGPVKSKPVKKFF